MDLEKQALEILRTFEGGEPYQLGYSGGKDSDVVFHLAKKSGVKFEAVHNHTTVDAQIGRASCRERVYVLV